MSPHHDSNREFKKGREPRKAEIATGDDGEPLGACIYLTQADLKAMGVNPTEAEYLSYVVEDAQLSITESEER